MRTLLVLFLTLLAPSVLRADATPGAGDAVATSIVKALKDKKKKKKRLLGTRYYQVERKAKNGVVRAVVRVVARLEKKLLVFEVFEDQGKTSLQRTLRFDRKGHLSSYQEVTVIRAPFEDTQSQTWTIKKGRATAPPFAKGHPPRAIDWQPDALPPTAVLFLLPRLSDLPTSMRVLVWFTYVAKINPKHAQIWRLKGKELKLERDGQTALTATLKSHELATATTTWGGGAKYKSISKKAFKQATAALPRK